MDANQQCLIFSLRGSPSFVDGHDFRDADLSGVADDCECLSLELSQITDDGIAALTRLHQLRCLDLDSTAITDIALTTVGSLASLEELWLEDTAVTDAGLKHLQRLHKLKFVSLAYCGDVSEEGIASLRSFLPALLVHL
jgi:hypothetical protein